MDSSSRRGSLRGDYLPLHLSATQIHVTSRKRGRLAFTAASLSLVLIVLFLVSPRFAPTVLDQLDETTWRTFDSSSDPLGAQPQPGLALAQTLFTPDCGLRWIEKGEICDGLREAIARIDQPVFDVVWSWVGGSGRLSRWRTALSSGERPNERRRQLAPIPAVPLARYGGTAVRHFQEHGELRYNLRSVFRYLPRARSYSLISTDLPTANESGPHSRVGQVPPFLKVGDGLRVLHHWQLFKVTRETLAKERQVYLDDEAAMRTAAIEWREAALPTFDSLAIESQLVHIPTSSEVLLYYNDDTFTLRPLQSTDFYSPLFGPVYRLQPDLLVDGLPPSAGRQGEWRA